MKAMRTMIAGLLVLVAAVFSGSGVLAAESDSLACSVMTPNRSVSAEGDYVALGDSIAAGWGATDRYGYAERLRDRMQEEAGESLALNNTAKAGLTSCGLLDQVTNDPITRKALAGARVVSISIGGNDLLSCTRDGYTNIDETCATQAVARFRRTWSEILKQLPLSDDGRLLAMTIYNPYKPKSAMATLADTYISQLNTIIKASNSSYPVQIVDVYAHFQGWQENGTWRGCAWTHFCTDLDIHPNNQGYAEIAHLHWLAYIAQAPSRTPEEEEPDYWWWGAQTPW